MIVRPMSSPALPCIRLARKRATARWGLPPAPAEARELASLIDQALVAALSPDGRGTASWSTSARIEAGWPAMARPHVQPGPVFIVPGTTCTQTVSRAPSPASCLQPEKTDDALATGVRNDGKFCSPCCEPPWRTADGMHTPSPPVACSRPWRKALRSHRQPRAARGPEVWA